MAGERLTILVLEDEPLIALDVEATLVEAGFNVAVTASCAEAESILEDVSPDAAVLDLYLKDGPCIAVAKKLVGRGIPFVVHTGYLGPDRDEIFAHGTEIQSPPTLPISSLRSKRRLDRDHQRC
ncbi:MULTISPECIES: response regulator [unclassified Mesorhizobium]|uniref:response regulator n=1 Tax=unclassified Mesorhizobium TaxID=325217 RepID=UPI0016756164|nr:MULTISPECIES: response regulator [unclassified Mesorhizobium]